MEVAKKDFDSVERQQEAVNSDSKPHPVLNNQTQNQVVLGPEKKTQTLVNPEQKKSETQQIATETPQQLKSMHLNTQNPSNPVSSKKITIDETTQQAQENTRKQQQISPSVDQTPTTTKLNTNYQHVKHESKQQSNLGQTQINHHATSLVQPTFQESTPLKKQDPSHSIVQTEKKLGESSAMIKAKNHELMKAYGPLPVKTEPVRQKTKDSKEVLQPIVQRSLDEQKPVDPKIPDSSLVLEQEKKQQSVNSLPQTYQESVPNPITERVPVPPPSPSKIPANQIEQEDEHDPNEAKVDRIRRIQRMPTFKLPTQYALETFESQLKTQTNQPVLHRSVTFNPTG